MNIKDMPDSLFDQFNKEIRKLEKWGANMVVKKGRDPENMDRIIGVQMINGIYWFREVGKGRTSRYKYEEIDSIRITQQYETDPVNCRPLYRLDNGA